MASVKLPLASRVAPGLWLGPGALYPICRAHNLGMADLMDRAANTGERARGAFVANVDRRVRDGVGWER